MSDSTRSEDSGKGKEKDGKRGSIYGRAKPTRFHSPDCSADEKGEDRQGGEFEYRTPFQIAEKEAAERREAKRLQERRRITQRMRDSIGFPPCRPTLAAQAEGEGNEDAQRGGIFITPERRCRRTAEMKAGNSAGQRHPAELDIDGSSETPEESESGLAHLHVRRWEAGGGGRSPSCPLSRYGSPIPRSPTEASHEGRGKGNSDPDYRPQVEDQQAPEEGWGSEIEYPTSEGEAEAVPEEPAQAIPVPVAPPPPLHGAGGDSDDSGVDGTIRLQRRRRRKQMDRLEAHTILRRIEWAWEEAGSTYLEYMPGIIIQIPNWPLHKLVQALEYGLIPDPAEPIRVAEWKKYPVEQRERMRRAYLIAHARAIMIQRRELADKGDPAKYRVDPAKPLTLVTMPSERSTDRLKQVLTEAAANPRLMINKLTRSEIDSAALAFKAVFAPDPVGVMYDLRLEKDLYKKWRIDLDRKTKAIDDREDRQREEERLRLPAVPSFRRTQVTEEVQAAAAAAAIAANKRVAEIRAGFQELRIRPENREGEDPSKPAKKREYQPLRRPRY